MPKRKTMSVVGADGMRYWVPDCEEAGATRLYQVPPGEVVLVGTLEVWPREGYGREPYLSLRAWCPFCRREHTARWLTPPSRLDEVRFVWHYDQIYPECLLRDVAPRGYFVGLDPNQEPEHERRIAEYHAEVAKWIDYIRSLPPVKHGHEGVSSEREWAWNCGDALDLVGRYDPAFHDELAQEGDAYAAAMAKWLESQKAVEEGGDRCRCQNSLS